MDSPNAADLPRLYTTTDTEESALNGVARQLFDRMLDLSSEGRVRVAVLAARGR